jgi:hyperosmotically inducible periplasmic protein
MERIFILISLLISSTAFAVGYSHTGMSPTANNQNVRSNSNTNDRYNNLDRRSNSMSSPSFYGAENNQLGESEHYSRMTGGSSAPATLDWQQQAGNPTTDWERSQSGAPGYYMERATGGSSELNRYPHQNQHPQRTVPPNSNINNTNMDNLRPDVERTAPAADMNATDANEIERSTGSSADRNDDTGRFKNSGATEQTAVGTTATGAAAMTAEDTNRAENPTELVQRIRREITADDALSVNAHNVKIISQSGQIYLKGPVNNMTEKSKVEAIAKRMAGNTNVVNQTYVQKK